MHRAVLEQPNRNSQTRTELAASSSSCSQSTHGCHHGDSAVLQFYRSAALEGSHVTIRSEAYGIPKADGRLHAQLVLKGT